MASANFLKDPLWYKDAVIYQIHVRAFFDSNNDGVGDFRGLIEKLDYLKDIGVNAVWLLPFYPSPLKDDGYDIADYEHVHPSYGNLQDFRDFISAAHKRGLRVITELVINHTSDQHEWFQQSRRAAPGAPERDFYVWSDNPHKYKEARIIFKDFEHSNWTYDPVAKSYYWHRFYSHQPDLNFNSPEIKKRIFKLVDYWLGMGVDGMRLDAVPYLYEKEGTSCENLMETHDFLKDMRAYIDERYPDAMLLAEANQWPEDAVAYFGKGDECHMCFHFPVMPRLFMAVKMEDRYSIIDILQQTPDIPDNCQWAMFLRNHDELTLEMVTDEERDYMYNVYANDERARINLGIRRRLAPLLRNNRKEIELLNGLLFSLPGTPIIYYGDELGMGDNIYLGDRNGVRTPFQWSPDRNAGFSKADPQKLYLPVITSPEYHYTSLNAENQTNNPHSLLTWTKGLIEMRKKHRAMSRGSLKFLDPENQKVLAFIREYEGQKILVLANLSRRAQYVELDLSDYKGLTPVELMGETAFPDIGNLPFLVTLGPYDFYWFELKDIGRVEANPLLENNLEAEHLPDPMDIFDQPELLRKFEKLVQGYLPGTRWFSAKNRKIDKVSFNDGLKVTNPDAAFLLIEVSYREQEDRKDKFFLSIARAEGAQAELIAEQNPSLVIAQYTLKDGMKAIYYDALGNPEVAQALLGMLRQGTTLNMRNGRIEFFNYHDLPEKAGEVRLMGLEQSNTSLRFGKNLFFKVFRRLEGGLNPEIEIGRHFLQAEFKATPALYAYASYLDGRGEYSLAVVEEFRSSEMTGWDLMVDAASREDSGGEKISNAMYRLGERTGEMHIALCAEASNSAFLPEAITPFYQRSLYQTLRNRSAQTLSLLKKSHGLTHESEELKQNLLRIWEEIDRKFEPLKLRGFGGQKIRVHGDYHLGQVLFSGGDFIILDFEGEPSRPISLRRLKHSALLDVAGMLRSIDYAFAFPAHEQGRAPTATAIDMRNRAKDAFLSGYFTACDGKGFLPQSRSDTQDLLEMFVLYKALYEVAYELGSRPDWVDIPLRGLLELVQK